MNTESSLIPPSLWSTKPYFRSTRKGKILKSVKENYLRDDIGLGFLFGSEDDKKNTECISIPDIPNLLSRLISDPENPNHLIICDANVLIHNLDILEHSSCAIANIVIPQTSLSECKKNSLSAYNRSLYLLREADVSKRCVIFFPNEHHIETQVEIGKASENDKNDEKIRKVADFLGTKMKGTDIQVILLTDDYQSRMLAHKNKFYKAQSVRNYIQQLEHKDPTLALSDLVAQFTTPEASAKSSKSSTSIFVPHISTQQLLLGIKGGNYYQGTLRAKRSSSIPSYFDCYVTVRQGEERVAVSITDCKNVNRAVDGDIVAIQLHSIDAWLNKEKATTVKQIKKESIGIAQETAEPNIKDEENIQESLYISHQSLKENNKDNGNIGQYQPTGTVVGIVRRNFRQNYCGSIYSTSKTSNKDQNKSMIDSTHAAIIEKCEAEHSDGSTTCVFFAVDCRIPPILIRTTQKDRLLGKRILVVIDSWPVDSPYPLGHYVKTLGTSGVKDVETEVLLHEHDIPCDPFPAKVLACLPPSDFKITIENSPGRLDLRHLPVLSIDPPGCKDIDDALHCSILPNGNYQIGVHIADVTHYVKPNTEIDKEAANRSTSTYLVNKRLDMLPSLLTTDLCSLKGNVDRYAFSVLWEVTPDAEIIHVDFKKSIIHSIAALTYQQAQALIDQPDTQDDKNDIQAGAVKRLASLARKFRKRRIDSGALTLASPEVKFVLDSESLNPTDVQSYALFEANALVEEFMLLANVTVGKKILRHYPTLSVLRRHPAPNRTMFSSLVSKAKCRGFDIDIEDSKRLADSLDAAVLPSDPYFNKLLRILSTRCMSPAQYFCSGEYKPSDWHHYGLAAPVYTHFTSPIRRYADVCVHRLLAASIGVDPLPVHLSSKSYLHDLTLNMNRRHRSAQLAGRASIQLHTLLYFSGIQENANEEDAYVLDIDASVGLDCPTLTVIVPRYGIEGRLSLSSMDDPNWIIEPDNHRIGYKHENVVYLQVFDKVKVKIWVKLVQENQKELILDLVHPQFGKLDTIKDSTNLKKKVRKLEDGNKKKKKRSRKS